MCYVSECENEWPHLHIKPLSEMMSTPTCEISPGSWFEWDGWYDGTDYNFKSFSDAESYLEYKRDEQYWALRRSVEEHGFWPDFAPEIIDGVIEEGHHRITLFHDISGQWCPWQDKFNYDQYESNWEHYVYSRTVPANA